MLDKYERWIHFYTASLLSSPQGAPNFDMKAVFKKLKERFDKNLCFKLVERDSACIRITRFAFNKAETSVALLLQYSDSKVSDPSFGDLVSGNLRQEPKLAGEGIAVSAHLHLKLTSLPGKPFEFMMKLEDVPGVGKSRILPFLNGMIKEIMSRDFVDAVDGKEKTCHPILIMDHLASQSLKENLDAGELRFIEVSKNKNFADMDEEGFLVRSTASVKVKIAPNLDGEASVGIVNRLKEKFSKQGYDHVKVIFKHKEGKQRTVDVSGHRADAGEALFGKIEMITLDNPLPQCSDNLNMEVLKKMNDLK